MTFRELLEQIKSREFDFSTVHERTGIHPKSFKEGLHRAGAMDAKRRKYTFDNVEPQYLEQDALTVIRELLAGKRK